MEPGKMKNLAQEFLREYLDKWNLDLNDLKDREQAIESINTLEASECEIFFLKQGIEILEYPEFAELVKLTLKEEVEQLEKKIDTVEISETEERENFRTETKSTSKNYAKIAQGILDELSWEKLSPSRKTKLIEEIRQIPIEELVKRLGDDFEKDKEGIEELRSVILAYMNEKKTDAVEDFTEIVQKILDKLNWKNLNSTEQNNIFGLYCQLSTNEFEKIIKENGGKELTREEIELLRDVILDKMDEKKIETPDDFGQNESILLPKELPIPLFKGLSNNDIDRLIEPFLTKINDENYGKIETEIINTVKNNIQTDYDEETVEVKIKNRLKEKYKNAKQLSFYQKMVQVFGKLDYDHLSTNEKVNIVEKIRNGEILTSEVFEDLDLSQEEMEKIKEAIIETIDYSKKIAKELIQKYIMKLKEADYSYFETLEKYLTKEKIKATEHGNYLRDSDIEMIIRTVSEEGKKIATEKILELPEVRAYIEKWNIKLRKASKEDIKVLEKELEKFKVSNEMLELTDFNKALLVEELEKKLIIIEKLDKLIASWKIMIKRLKTEEIMPFYEKTLKCDKAFLACENYNNEVFKKVKKEVLEMLLQEITKRMAKDMGIYDIEDLESFISKIDAMKPEVFEKYKVPENMQDELRKRLKEEIKKEQNRRLIQDMDQYFDINTTVVLNHEVNRYEYAEDLIENENDENKVKAGKSGKIKGYVVKKDNVIDIAFTKEELKKYLEDGYQFGGYEFEYRNFLKKHSIFVKESDLKEKKQSWIQKHWKKIAGIALFTTIFAAGMAVFNKKEKPKETETSTVIESLAEGITLSSNSESEEQNQEFDNIPEMNEEEKLLNEVPDLEAQFTISEADNDKEILYATIDEIRNTEKADTAYHKSGTTKVIDGLVLESPDGVRNVYQDTNEIIDLLTNHDYKYIGCRAINDYSYDENGNIIAYEGFYGAESVDLLDAQKTLARRR